MEVSHKVRLECQTQCAPRVPLKASTSHFQDRYGWHLLPATLMRGSPALIMMCHVWSPVHVASWFIGQRGSHFKKHVHAGNQWRKHAPVQILALVAEYRERIDEQVVVLFQVLAAEINFGYKFQTVRSSQLFLSWFITPTRLSHS